MRILKISWALALLLLILSVGIMNVDASPETSMYFDPEQLSGDVGSTFIVDIMIENVGDLFSWQAHVEWDPMVLNLSTYWKEVGGYWYEYPEITFGDFMDDQEFGTNEGTKVNYWGGWLEFGESSVGEVPGVSGSGWLGSLNFTVLQAKNSVLDIESSYWMGGPPYATTFLYNRYLEDIPMAPANGRFVHVPTPWATDLNQDGHIDIRDLAMVAIQWGKGPGYEGPEDITGPGAEPDGYVDIYDLAAVAMDYGEYY